MTTGLEIAGPLVSQVLAEIPPPGGYLSFTKILVMLVLATPWLATAPWAYRDARSVRLPQRLWAGTVLGAGAVGFVLWLLVPSYWIGLACYVVLFAGAAGTYVFLRNSRVPANKKVLTPKHLTGVFSGRRRKVVEPGPAVKPRVRVYAHDGRPAAAPSATEDPIAAQGYALSQEFLYDALWRRAGEAELLPGGEQMGVRLVIDGVAAEGQSMPLLDGEAIIQYLKRVGGMTVEERRRPQEGKVSADMGGKSIDIELATTGTTGGQRMRFRVVQEMVQTQLDNLGMSDETLHRLRDLSKHVGLVIVSSKPGNGMTSTLYSMLREHDAFTRRLTALEAKVRVDMENVSQVAYRDASKLAGALADALRKDPDVLMVDQCPDDQTADLIRRAAAEKTVLLGVQAPDAFTALAKWVKACGDAAAAMAPVRAVLCQVLLRKLCASCRESYTPDPRLLAKANIPAQKVDKFYQAPSDPPTDKDGKPVVCPSCQGTGYVGRTAAFELLEVTDEIRQLVVSGAQLPRIKAACRKNRMLYLQEQSLMLVIAGVTSIQEVIRVTQHEKKA